MNYELLRTFQSKMSLYEDVVSKLIATTPVGGVFVDCGAHAGFHTETMLGRADVANVVAIEAIPSLCNNLEKKFGSNKKFRLVRAAIGRELGELEFNVATNQMGYSGIRRRDVADLEWESVRVPLTTLDSCIGTNLSNIGLIKLDLEGGEFDALRGGDGVLCNSSPLIVFENGLKKSADLYSYTSADFFGFFARHDYVLHDFFSGTVNQEYWNDTLRTYMFVGVKRSSVLGQWYMATIGSILASVASSISV